VTRRPRALGLAGAAAAAIAAAAGVLLGLPPAAFG
jgi:hypothetical protein